MVQVHLGPPNTPISLASPIPERYRRVVPVTKVRHVMSGLPRPNRVSRYPFALLAALVVTFASGLSAAHAAPVAATGTFIATPNGQVGIQQTVVVKAPRAMRNQVVTVTFTNPATQTNAGQTIVNAQGFANIAWTPPLPGSWTITASGLPASSATTTVTVTPMRTTTVLDAPNQVGANVPSILLAEVDAVGGIIAPSGTITVRNQANVIVATGTLTASGTVGKSVANIAWTPTTATTSLVATFTPSTAAFTGSVSPAEVPFISQEPTIALRFPPALYVGVPVTLQAVPTSQLPPGWGGSGAFQIYRDGIMTFASGSQPLSNGVVSWVWTPTQTGLQTIQVQFATGNLVFNGTSTQNVNVLPTPGTDSITVTPAIPATLAAGTSLTLTAGATSGATVTLATSGPCVVNAAILTVLSAGTCTVTASSVGSGFSGLRATSATYTVNIPATPAKPKPKPKR